MKHEYTFEWTTGSAADNMIRLFREKNIHYEYDCYFNLCACIGPGSDPVPVEYYQIADRLFGIAQKPQRTSEYFHLSPAVLYADRGDGWTKPANKMSSPKLSLTEKIYRGEKDIAKPATHSWLFEKRMWHSQSVQSRINGFAAPAASLTELVGRAAWQSRRLSRRVCQESDTAPVSFCSAVPFPSNALR